MNRLHIIYEDEQILVCQKDAGMPVQTASVRTADLTDLVRRHLSEKMELEANNRREDKKLQDRSSAAVPYLGVVHRLDQPVRGLVVFALNEKAAASLSAQAAGGMKKEYLALVRTADIDYSGSVGSALILNHQEVLLEDYLIRDPKTNRSRVAGKGEKGSKQAALRCRIIDDPQSEMYQAAVSIFAEEIEILKEQKEQYAVLWIRLLTGRHHQIRVQLSHAGIPIIGDRKYGKEAGAGDYSGKTAYPALCAWRLELIHPKTKKEVVITLS